MSIDVIRLAEILRHAAQTEVLPRFRRLDAGAVRRKSEAIDLVTEADEQAEHAIRAEVEGLWPEALFVGEEAVAADPRLLDALDESELAVVVDPIDGTANFVAGLPLFAVMAAVVAQGETVAGIIYDPMGDDWVMAERGAGAFLRRPSEQTQRLAVAAAPALEAMVGTVSVAYLPRPIRPRILANLDKVRVANSYRVAGHEYRLFAGGHTHFACYQKLMPWDHLGGALIAEEAGGHVARLDGSRYRPQHRSGGLLMAPDAESWTRLRREVFTI